MNPVFADTSYFFALLNPKDQYHPAAVRLSQQLASLVLTTQFVLLELGNAMKSPRSRETYVRFVEHVRSSDRARVLPASDRLFQAGMQLFASRNDKEWSLTDCTSFVVMEHEGIRDALTADHHFEQVGLKLLMQSRMGAF